jgi:hypothetical protein
MGGGASPIDQLKLEMELMNAQKRSPEEAAKARRGNAYEALSMVPGPGNVIAAKEAKEAYGNAYEDVTKGNYKRGAVNAGLGTLNAVGAVTGLPFGKAAKAAATGAKDRLNVFVPVEEGKLSETARSMREKGYGNDDVFADTGLLFGPDGSLRREIPDRYMDINWSAKPGDKTTVGDFVSHPSLFREMPELKSRGVTITDKVDALSEKLGRPPKGIARTDPATGDFEFSMVGSDPYGDIAKLLQYDIVDRVGWSPAGRHNLSDQITDINTAQLRATQAGADRKAIGAYTDALDRIREDVVTKGLSKPKPDTFSYMSGQLGNRTAGNVDSKLVRGRADLPGAETIYPYLPDAPWNGGRYRTPDFDNILTLPPSNATADDWSQFLEDWYRFGSGKGK